MKNVIIKIIMMSLLSFMVIGCNEYSNHCKNIQQLNNYVKKIIVLKKEIVYCQFSTNQKNINEYNSLLNNYDILNEKINKIQPYFGIRYYKLMKLNRQLLLTLESIPDPYEEDEYKYSIRYKYDYEYEIESK